MHLSKQRVLMVIVAAGIVCAGVLMPGAPRRALAQVEDSKRLSEPLVGNGDVDTFQISPDGNWVVYAADQDTDEITELYSVP